MGSIVGLDSISPSAKDDTNNNKRIPFSPISQRATSIYKDLTNPLSSLLDHRRSKLCELKSKDLFASPSEQPATEKPENSCQECYKKLSGKLVRIPNSQVRYHWSCLKCESCKGVFENTSFIIDSSKKVYHPKVHLFFYFICIIINSPLLSVCIVSFAFDDMLPMFTCYIREIYRSK